MKAPRRLWVPALGLIILAGGVGTASVALKRPKPIPAEKVVVVERGDVARSVVARGKIEPLSKVEIKSKANGIIEALLVDVGDAVKAGQVLGELDKEDLQAQVREAKATRDGEEANMHTAAATLARARIESANPELEFTRRDFERAQELFKQKIASQQQLDDASRAYEVSRNKQQLLEAAVQCAETQLEQTRARVAAAKAALDRAEEGLGYATIRAPISGLVLTRDTELGDAVSSILNLGSAATLIMTLGDMSTVYIKGEVDEADIGKAELRAACSHQGRVVSQRVVRGGSQAHRADGQRAEQRDHIRGAGFHFQSPRQAPGQDDRQCRDRPGRAQARAAGAGGGAGL